MPRGAVHADLRDLPLDPAVAQRSQRPTDATRDLCDGQGGLGLRVGRLGHSLRTLNAGPARTPVSSGEARQGTGRRARPARGPGPAASSSVDVVAPARHPDRHRAHALGGGDVERRVPDDEHLAEIECMAEQPLSTLYRGPGERDAVLGIRAVATDEEEMVQPPASRAWRARRLPSPPVVSPRAMPAAVSSRAGPARRRARGSPRRRPRNPAAQPGSWPSAA